MEATRKKRILEILTDSFDTNLSVNYIVKQDRLRAVRMRRLMDYSYKRSEAFGQILYSENACALLMDPKQKRTTLRTVFWDLKLVLGVIGLGRLRKVLKRESTLNHHKPGVDFVYLWFIGVDPKVQGQGKGTALLQKIIAEQEAQGRAIYLETSNPRNFPFYESLGFACFGVIDSVDYEIRQYVYGA